MTGLEKLLDSAKFVASFGLGDPVTVDGVQGKIDGIVEGEEYGPMLVVKYDVPQEGLTKRYVSVEEVISGAITPLGADGASPS